MIQNGILLAQHGDVVISPVHGRAHQVGGAGIQANVLPVNMLLMQHRGDQVAVGCHHEPAQLGENRHIPHAVGGENPLIPLPDTPADGLYVTFGLLGPVVHANTPGQVHEGDVGPGGVAQPHRQQEQLGGQLRVVFVGGGVGSQEGMDAEMPGTQLLQPGNGPGHLILGHTVLGIPGHIHNGVAQAEGAAGVKAQTHGLRHRAHGGQEIHIGGIVQVDIGPQLPGLKQILLRGDVGGEHDVVARDAHRLAKQQLCVAGAVTATALLMEKLQNIGIGGGLHGKILPEAGIPGKGGFQLPHILPDARLVIDVEGGGNLRRDLTGLLQGQKGGFLHIRVLFREISLELYSINHPLSTPFHRSPPGRTRLSHRKSGGTTPFGFLSREM